MERIAHQIRTRPEQPKVTRSDMRALRKRMPPKYRKEVVEAMKAQGRDLSPQHVSRQFTDPKDLDIIEQIVLSAERHERRMVDLQQRFRRPKT